MGKYNLYRIQNNRLLEGYNKMQPEELRALKDKLLSLFKSQEMRDCFEDYFLEYSDRYLIMLIAGAQRSIEYKAQFMAELAERFPCSAEDFDPKDAFETYVKLYQDAYADMRVDDGEKAIYLLIRYYHNEKDDTMPFFDFETALQYIETDVKKEVAPEDMDDPYIWYEIEKWVGADVPTLKSTYTVSMYGEIWDYCPEEVPLWEHPFGYNNAYSLELDTPFSIGDVITIDCRPFMPLRHGVILFNDRVEGHYGISYCLYANEDGTMDFGNLHHTWVFEDSDASLMSVMYNIEHFCGELPPDEAFMVELGAELAKLYQAASETYEKDWWNWFDGLHDSKLTPQELIDKVKGLD